MRNVKLTLDIWGVVGCSTRDRLKFVLGRSYGNQRLNEKTKQLLSLAFSHEIFFKPRTYVFYEQVGRQEPVKQTVKVENVFQLFHAYYSKLQAVRDKHVSSQVWYSEIH